MAAIWGMTFLAIVHEARDSFLTAHQWSEMDIDGCSLIMVDAALMYLAKIGVKQKLGSGLEISLFN